MSNTILSLHNKAMSLSDIASLSDEQADSAAIIDLYRQAYKLEAEAADLVESGPSAAITRSVLYRSAAAMALDAGELEDARRFIYKGLAAFPPSELELELLELLDTVTFQRHLQLRDVVLEQAELQLVIEGNEVGPGIALTDAFITRVKGFEKLIWRTAERLLGLDFRKQGPPSRSIQERYSLYMSAPRAGSFAVTLSLGRQMELPGFDTATVIIDDLLHNLTIVNESGEEGLQESIPDPIYRENFAALAKQIAPDGDKVSLVGFTTARNGQEVSVSMRKTRSLDLIASTDGNSQNTLPAPIPTTQVTGRLLFADARKKEGKIELVAEDGQTYKILVSEGYLADIVRPLFDEVVTVIGIRKGKHIHLKDIR